MTDTHTPGPWFVAKHSWSETSVYGRDGTICTLDIYDEATEENQDELERRTAERARLIAASPVLLEALEALVAWYDDVIGGDAVQTVAARDAIKLAREGK